MRLLGIIIPDEKRIEVALRYIYGIGETAAQKIVRDAGIDPNKRTKTLSLEEANRLKEIIEKNYKIEGDLRREITGNIKRLKDIKSYRGMRHIRRLPSHGQSTKRNSRTVRGNVRKSVGSGRKPAGQKT
ncbi:MAG: 30S ribosomal protein S13 [Parcubacteria group bacterium GW2011_GWB1_46_8]|nr:MAG: 30S ribosomal protein S13 [Parcubacteria group bacterium GW2011_GWF1_45_5]KKU10526.1 MAG: 30S ribosomal protein S13 [Parcubacteria group bacterium GW2011_GWA1_45_7]KKU44185.1 MAG: 30S ribosomal protein S13 [Parcubacteria group bacterium GW2011_GWA2_46_7]KKU46610.1 MAG: 30S ribosomal protein S13 [Parcubacteria group bacterium GW2011_GWB1_46_8]KKU47347.1 MAG: 30S ribosomal protein S13 [Parcubacteria group bacterium GW2011_GWF2_46_8]